MGDSTGPAPQQGGGFDRTTVRPHTIHRYFMGDMEALTDWLQLKPVIYSLPIWIFRGLGAPIFLNNPISGLLIIIALFLGNPSVAVNGLVGLVMAILTALLLQQPRNDIESGGVTFHGLLVGIAVTAFHHGNAWYPWGSVAVLILAPLSVCVASGLSAILSTFQLPALNLPFDVTAFIFVAACRYHGYTNIHNPHFPTKVAAPPTAQFDDSGVQWGQAFLAILLTPCQVYGVSSAISGALMLVAMLVTSPIICFHAVLGSSLGILTAMAIAVPLPEIYTGEWSFNAMLACASLGGFFWVLTPYSHLMANMAAVTATLVYGAAKSLLTQAGLPALAFPFVFTTLIFLSVQSGSQQVRRIPLHQISFPELHLRLYRSQAVGDSSLA